MAFFCHFSILKHHAFKRIFNFLETIVLFKNGKGKKYNSLPLKFIKIQRKSLNNQNYNFQTP